VFGWLRRKEGEKVIDTDNSIHYHIPVVARRKIAWYDVYVFNEKFLGKCFECYDRRGDELYLGETLVATGIVNEDVYDKLLEFRGRGFITVASGAWKFDEGIAFGALKWDGKRLTLLGMDFDESILEKFIKKEDIVYNVNAIIRDIKHRLSHSYSHHIDVREELIVEKEPLKVVKYIFSEHNAYGGYREISYAYVISLDDIGNIGIVYKGVVYAYPQYREYVGNVLGVIKEIEGEIEWFIKR